MRIEKERKRIGLFKVITKEVYITDDDKQFYDKTEAEEWELYLNNKSRVHNDYKFEEISPLSFGLRYINNPIFAYKFYIEDYNKEKISDIINYLHGIIIDSGVDFRKGDVSVKSHFRNKMDGWHIAILNNHLDRGYELHFFFMSDLVSTVNNE